ncbi:MAG: FISUMP domain-containing protein, partial [Melioribacteraceae bacterium]
MKSIFTLLILILLTTAIYSQNPCPDVATVTYAGKIYNTVQIGTQCWLRENLDLGTMIAGTIDQSNNGILEKYCYNDDPANCDKYGGLYTWNEAMKYLSSNQVHGICPAGWHIPTTAEFNTLQQFVNDDANSLKAVTEGTGSYVGTNTSGFSGMLAGSRGMGGHYTHQ